MNFYIQTRQSYLLFHIRNNKCSIKIVLISNISTDKMSLFNLMRIYDSIADDVQKIVINRNYTQLMQIIKKRDTFHLALKNVATQMIQKTFKSIEKNNASIINTSFLIQFLYRQHRSRIRFSILSWLSSLSLIDVKMNLIDHNRKEIFRFNRHITNLQVNQKKFASFNFVFISFNNVRSVYITYQSFIDSKSATFQIQNIDVESRNII